jgi:hypothetical protein
MNSPKVFVRGDVNIQSKTKILIEALGPLDIGDR